MSHLLQQLMAHLMQWQGTLQAYGWWGVLAFALALAVLQMGLIPLSIFAVAGGMIFGFEKAFIAVQIGTNLGASINFLIARYVARGAVSRYLSHHEKFRLIDSAIGREGGKIIALLRLCPLPFGLANYCYGLTAVRFWPYAIATFLAITPANALFPWVGASAQEGLAALNGTSRPHSPMEYVLLGVGLVAAFCALAYITKVAKAALAKGESGPAAAPVAD
jgi:uncharacterized membrane protein YdjX (TVP38/TMEM64 family)